jgi:hypothetical protein
MNTKLDDVITLLKKRLDECEEYLFTLAKRKSPEFKDACASTQENLPLLMLRNQWAAKRMKGEELTANDAIEALSDCEMEFEEYKHLGENDGQLFVIYALFEKLGMETEAHKAMSMVYSE